MLCTEELHYPRALAQIPICLVIQPKLLMHRKLIIMANLQPDIWSQFILGIRPIKLIEETIQKFGVVKTKQEVAQLVKHCASVRT